MNMNLRTTWSGRPFNSSSKITALSGDSLMKLCAVSPFTTASKDDILGFLGKRTAGLVVLPLFLKRIENTPAPEEVRRVIRRSLTVFVDYGNSKRSAMPCLVTHSKIIPMPAQVFGRHPTAEEMDKLVATWPGRTFRMGSRSVTFIICGEINAFNPDGSVKHKRVLPFDILANPTHTVMGRWQHLGKKLSALSAGSVAIHVANNDRNHNNLNTDVRIYRNGKLQSDKVKHNGKLKWCEIEI